MVRLSRPVVAATLLRRHSRLGRVVTAPSCLAATGGSSDSGERSTESSKKEQAAAEKAAATLLRMVAKLVVELGALCSNEPSAGQQLVGCRCMQVAAADDIPAGRVDVAGARWRRSLPVYAR